MSDVHKWAKEITHFVNGGEVERVWADTDFVPLDEIPEPNFNAPIDPGYEDDVYSDIVRIVAILLIFAILYMWLA